MSGLIFKQPKRELLAAGEWDWAGGGYKGWKKKKAGAGEGKRERGKRARTSSGCV